VLIIRKLKLYYTASVIVTPVGGRQVYRLGESSLNLYIGRPPTGVIIPDAVQYYFNLLMMSTQCSKHIEAYNKLIIKQGFMP